MNSQFLENTFMNSAYGAIKETNFLESRAGGINKRAAGFTGRTLADLQLERVMKLQ